MQFIRQGQHHRGDGLVGEHIVQAMHGNAGIARKRASLSGLRPTQQVNSIFLDWLAAFASTRPQAPTPINAALSGACAIVSAGADMTNSYNVSVA